jgi:Putative effector of murein hydrolase
VLCGLTYKDYTPAKNIMTALLGPATVGLAVPLYRYRMLLARNGAAILGSVALGSFLAMLLAAVLTRLGGLPDEVVMSILPKSVSIPFAVEIAKIYNGVPPLAAAFVVATGTSGSLLGAGCSTLRAWATPRPGAWPSAPCPTGRARPRRSWRANSREPWPGWP